MEKLSDKETVHEDSSYTSDDYLNDICIKMLKKYGTKKYDYEFLKSEFEKAVWMELYFSKKRHTNKKRYIEDNIDKYINIPDEL